MTDDRHSQPFDGFNVWKGDNIQFAFQLPGRPDMETAFAAAFRQARSHRLPDPTGFDPAAVAKACRLVTTREDNVTGYDFTLPGKRGRHDAGDVPQRIPFQPARERQSTKVLATAGFTSPPGIGDSKNPDKFPFVVFE
ncbi:MAG: hypothetical protein V8T86_12930 [Victivallis sp.]